VTDEDSKEEQPSDYFTRELARLVEAQPTLEDQWFKDQEVWLDGRTFTRCFFEKCTLRTATGAFFLDDCRIVRSALYLSGNALNAAKLSNFILLSANLISSEAWVRIPQSARPYLKDDLIITFRDP
jgi:hypothetical protein